MPRSSPIVRASILLGFDRFLAERGVDAAKIFRDAGINFSDAGDPERDLPLNSVIRVMEDAAEAAGDPCLGLHFARTYPVGGTGVLGFLFVNSVTVADAMKTVERYVPLLRAPQTIAFEEEPGGAVLWWRWPDEAKPPYTQLYAAATALLVSRLKLLANPGWQPLRVEMQNGPLKCKEMAERVFGPNIEYLAKRNAVHVDAETLAQPVARAEPQLRMLLERVGQQMIADMPPQGDISEQTRTAVEHLMSERRLALDEVASYLGYTPRTLQTRLSQSGTTFEDVLNAARKARAEQLLSLSDMSMTEIAQELGFSELSAFTRAAVRWFGRTPSAQRQHLRAAAVATH